MHHPFRLEGWLQNSREQPRYNTHLYSGQDLPCSTTQLHRTQNWEHTYEEATLLSEKSIHDITHMDYPSTFRRCTCKKNFAKTISVVDFFKAFDSIHRRKMDQVLLANSLLKETVASIMMLNKNSKVKVRSQNGDKDYFDIVASVLQRDTLASYLFIICLDYVLRTSIDIMKDNGFVLEKGKKQKISRTNERSRKYPAHTITDADFTDDIALPTNTPAQAETLQHGLERTATGIGLHVKADKTEFMCFNERGDISILNGSSLKLVDKFTYQGSSVSSTETDTNSRLAKAINRRSVIWKSELTDRIKRIFFQAAVVSILL